MSKYVINNFIIRLVGGISSAFIVLFGLLPIFFGPQTVFAGVVSSRSIKMSSSSI